MKLIMIDLDNTLINSDYQLNVAVKKFRDTIKELTKKNIKVGLCSDSATITLRQWTQKLQLTGPIIAERGAVICYDANSIETILDGPNTLVAGLSASISQAS